MVLKNMRQSPRFTIERPTHTAMKPNFLVMKRLLAHAAVDLNFRPMPRVPILYMSDWFTEVLPSATEPTYEREIAQELSFSF